MENMISTHREKLNDLQKLAAQITDFVGAGSIIQVETDILDLDRQLAEIVESIEACKNLSESNNRFKSARKSTVTKSHNLINNVKEVSLL